MALKHNFCRTCGSKIHVKSVCYNCGCPPLKGNLYCPDCGASTLPDAILCVNCNASLERKYPVTLVALLIASVLVITAIAGVIISQSEKSTTKTNISNDSITITNKVVEPVVKENKPKEVAHLIPKILLTLPVISNIDTSKHVAKIQKPPVEIKQSKQEITEIDSTRMVNKILQHQNDVLTQSLALAKNKEIIPPVIKSLPPSTKNISVNVFSAKELDDYTVGCSFFSNIKNQNSVIFFYTRSLGYLKVGKIIYEVKMKLNDKPNGIIKFSGEPYNVTIEIDGLSGSEDQWFASGTISIMDATQGVVSQRKIYSACEW